MVQSKIQRCQRLALLSFLALVWCVVLVVPSATAAPISFEQSIAEPDRAWTAKQLERAHAFPIAVNGDGESLRPSSAGSTSPSSTLLAGEDAGQPISSPNREIGVVFAAFPTSSGGSALYRCSATSVDSPARDLVLTAGHCAFNPLTGAAATSLVFVPGYRNGIQPLGVWPGQEISTTPQWASSYSSPAPDWGNDLAFVHVGEADGYPGVRLADVIGSLPITFHSGRDQIYTQMGYPSVEPYDGSLLYRLSAAYAGDDAYYTPRPMSIMSDFTGGSSGGPWLTSAGAIAGVTSYSYPGAPGLAGRMFSPYLGNNAQNLYAANGGEVPILPPDEELSPPPEGPSPSPPTKQAVDRRPTHIKVLRRGCDANSGSGFIKVKLPTDGFARVKGPEVTGGASQGAAGQTVVLRVEVRPRTLSWRMLRAYGRRAVAIRLVFRPENASAVESVASWLPLKLKR